MMQLHVIASGSKANCYLLETSSGTIILEAGVPIKKVLHALNFDLTHVIGCFVTHEHGDHAKHVKEYIEHGINVYMSKGTKETLNLKYAQIIPTGKKKVFKNISVSPFETEHDAKEPIGFLINDVSTGEKLLFATDTYYVKYKFNKVNYILVECNYALDILDDNVENGHVRAERIHRLRKSHFELGNVKKFISANNTKHLKNVVLLHLSAQNSDQERFKKEVEAITRANVNIAESGLKITLGDCGWEL